jgi:hypothetical protein
MVNKNRGLRIFSEVFKFITKDFPLYIFFNFLFALAYGFVTYKAWSNNDLSGITGILIGLVGVSLALSGICASLSSTSKNNKNIYTNVSEIYLYSALSAIVGFALSYAGYQLTTFEIIEVRWVGFLLKALSIFLLITNYLFVINSVKAFYKATKTMFLFLDDKIELDV